jgi:xanthine dehydrogenase accessory factor
MGISENETFDMALRWLRAGHAVVLGTVIRTSGSAPRQAGSHIAIRDDGAFAGSVSAGCVEGAVIEEALAALKDARNRRLRFGVADDHSFTLGLACGGEIEVFLEPLTGAQRAMLETLQAARREGRVLVRALDVETGEHRLIDPVADASGLGRAAARAVETGINDMVTVAGRAWYLTVYNNEWELVIIGAVHIAQALAAIAAPAGYHVRVIDPRAAYATDERFAGVRLVRDWPDDALAAQPLTARSALVALAHDPRLDDAALAAALRSPAGYIGALGSARSHARRMSRLAELGFAPRQLARIHGPVGLPIGARAPAEIAIAILAQLIQLQRAPRQRRIAGIVLAAGKAQRMGHNKLVMTVDGKPLVRHAVDAALRGGLDPVIVVTGHESQNLRACLADLPICFVHNDAFAHGLSTSLRAGMGATPYDCDGAMVLLGDMPGISAELVRQLTAAFDPAMNRSICVATARGVRGNPVLWGREHFGEMESLRGDQGARSLIEARASQVCDIEAGDDAPLADLDTPDALKAYCA